MPLMLFRYFLENGIEKVKVKAKHAYGCTKLERPQDGVRWLFEKN